MNKDINVRYTSWEAPQDAIVAVSQVQNGFFTSLFSAGFYP